MPKISALPAASSVEDDDLIVIVQDGVTKRATADLITGTPPGSDTQVIINDGGDFGADPGLTYDKTGNVLTVTGGLQIGTDPSDVFSGIDMSNGNVIAARNSTDNDNVTLLQLTASDVVEIGDGGYDVTVTTGNGRDLVLESDTTSFTSGNGVTEWAKVEDGDLYLGGALGPWPTTGTIRLPGDFPGWSWTTRNSTDTNDLMTAYAYNFGGGFLGLGSYDGTTATTFNYVYYGANRYQSFFLSPPTPSLALVGFWLAHDNVDDIRAVIVDGDPAEPVNLVVYGKNASSSYGGTSAVGLPSALGGGRGAMYLGQAATNVGSNPTGGIVLWVDAADDVLRYRRPDGTVVELDGSSGGVAGADTQVQYNDGGSMGADAGLTYNDTTDVLSVTGGLALGASAYWSVGTTPATTGAGRLPTNTYIYARNAGNTADISVAGSDNSDVTFFGDGTNSGTAHLRASTNVYLTIGATSYLLVTSSLVQVANGALLKLQDSSGGQGYRFQVSNLSADRDVTLPLLTAGDTFVFESHTQTMSNKTFVAPVLGAATATSIDASSYLAAGSTPATAGEIRLKSAFVARFRNNANSANGDLIQTTASDQITIGQTGTVGAVNLLCNGTILIRAGQFTVQDSAATENQFKAGSSLIEIGKPRVGTTASPNTAFASEGRATQAMADTNQTLANTKYSRALVLCTGALTAQRDLVFPHPASEDASYAKDIDNQTTGGFGVLAKTGTGTTLSITATGITRVWITPSGVQIAM